MEESVKEVRRERLEAPSQEAFERRFLVDGGRPSSKPDIAPPAPPTALLSRLQNFLPALQSANAQLLQQAPAAQRLEMEDASGEEEEEGARPYVELDLACGLFDLKDSAAVAAAERSLTHHGVMVERFGGDSSSDDSSSEEDDDAHEGGDAGGLIHHEPDAITPMEAEEPGGSGVQQQAEQQQQQQQQAAAGAPRRAGRAKAKQRRRRAQIEVLG